MQKEAAITKAKVKILMGTFTFTIDFCYIYVADYSVAVDLRMQFKATF